MRQINRTLNIPFKRTENGFNKPLKLKAMNSIERLEHNSIATIKISFFI